MAQLGTADKCQRLHDALCNCEKRLGKIGCRHLNKALAECIIGEACPNEWEAVTALCSSSGIPLKRAQCQLARISLASCISSLQEQQNPPTQQKSL